MKTSTAPARFVTLCITLVAALSLAACGGSDEPEAPDSTSAAAPGEHNDADVRFATDMIPHHAQALLMTDMVIGRDVDPELAKLVDDIRAAQAPEIELMVDWLQEWGEPVPETARDHANSDHGGGHDTGDGAGDSGGDEGHGGMPEMSGMMSEEQLAELEDAPPAEFEDLWVSMMIEHHEGAVAMAETQLDEGAYQPALDLAEEIISGQNAEIEQMQAMLEE